MKWEKKFDAQFVYNLVNNTLITIKKINDSISHLHDCWTKQRKKKNVDCVELNQNSFAMTPY